MPGLLAVSKTMLRRQAVPLGVAPVIRRCALALILSIAGWHMLANALGLSDIEVTSALNEPFEAEIKLINAPDLSPDELIVRLASSEDFERVGVERFFFLSDLIFRVDFSNPNQPVVRVSTLDPVAEPFVDFVLELTWPSGRLLKNFTVLLDPPDYTLTPIAPAQLPAVSEGEVPIAPVPEAPELIGGLPPVVVPPAVASAPAGSAPVSPPAPLRASELPLRQAPPARPTLPPNPLPSAPAADPFNIDELNAGLPPLVLTGSSGGDGSTPDQVMRGLLAGLPGELPPPAPAPDAVVQAPASTPFSAYQGDTYGVVGRDDTLWNIASLVRPGANVSVQQTMLALVRLNPEAFIGSNVNWLKAGYVLRVPDYQEVNLLSHADAVAQINEHNRRWERGLDLAPVGGRTRVASTAQPPTSGGELRLVTETGAAGNAVGGSMAASQPISSAQSTNAPAADSTAAAAAAAASAELGEARLRLEAALRDNEALRSRLLQSEASAEDLRRRIELQNIQLARLQQAVTQNAQAAQQEDDALAAPGAVPGEPTPAPPATAPDTSALPAQPPPVVQPPVTQPPAPSPPPAAPPPPPDLATRLGKDPLGTITSLATAPSPLGVAWFILVGGGLGALIALVALGLFAKRLIANRPKGEGTENGEEAGVSQFMPSLDMDADSSEGEDVIGEADYEMAYGRFSEAAKVLKAAVEVHPKRADIRLKLLEVCVESGDVEGFNEQAAALQEFADSDAITLADSLAARLPGAATSSGSVTDSSSAMLPDRPAGGSGMDIEIMGEDSAGGQPDLDIDLFLGQDSGGDDAPAAEADDALPDLDDDADSLDLAGDEGAAAEDAEAEDGSGLEFDLDLSGDSDSASADDDAGDGDLSFDIDEMPSNGDSADGDSGGDENLLTMEGDAMSADDLSAGDDDLTVSADDGLLLDSEADDGLSLDAGGDDELLLDEGGDAGGDAGGSEEVATKLELARAYVDMGDESGAKEILEEVVRDGNDTEEKRSQ